jgi:hypothetical protein
MWNEVTLPFPLARMEHEKTGGVGFAAKSIVVSENEKLFAWTR